MKTAVIRQPGDLVVTDLVDARRRPARFSLAAIQYPLDRIGDAFDAIRRHRCLKVLVYLTP